MAPPSYQCVVLELGDLKCVNKKSGWGHAQQQQKKEDYNSSDHENDRSYSRRILTFGIPKNDLAMLAQKHADSKQQANEHKVLGLTVFVKLVAQQMTAAAQMLKLYTKEEVKSF